ncbi:MAG: aminotransferase class IV, partial [Deltaproteobacteria bacterium]
LAKMEAERKGVYEGIFITPDGLVLEGTSTNVFIVSKAVLKTPLTYVPPLFSSGGISSPPLKRWGISSPPFLRGGKGGLYGGILPGIMRQAVIEAAKKNGLKAIEGMITVKELMNADEAFLTNSIIEVAPMVKVDSRPIGDGRPGPVTRRIQRLFSN